MKSPYRIVATEFEMHIPGQPEPSHIIRRLKLRGLEKFRVVTWAPTSEGRALVGYFDTVDSAAEVAWRAYCDSTAVQHELASKTHGGTERSGRD